MTTNGQTEPTAQGMLDKLGKDFLSDGWPGFDETGTRELNETETAEMIAKKKELADAVYSTFKTSAGKITLEWLLDNTLRRAAFNPDHPNPMQYGFMREGQNGIVHAIVSQIHLSLNPAEPQQKRKEDVKL